MSEMCFVPPSDNEIMVLFFYYYKNYTFISFCLRTRFRAPIDDKSINTLPKII